MRVLIPHRVMRKHERHFPRPRQPQRGVAHEERMVSVDNVGLKFVHGGRDPFGSHEEMKTSLKLVPAPTMLLEVEGAGHELLGKKANEDLPSRIVQAFQQFFKQA